VVELDKLDDGKAIRAEMFNVIDRSSVPAIFFDGDFIGGCNDGGSKGGLVKMDESGELDQVLQTILG
jgi:glutaredoxin-related protein